MKLLPLNQRLLLSVKGNDRYDFLQGLVTVDINKLQPDKALWGAFLSPQGKVLFEVMLYDYAYDDAVFIDVHLTQGEQLFDYLQKYILRSNVKIEKLNSFFVTVIWDLDDHQDDLKISHFKDYFTVQDPRTPAMGMRRIAVESNHQRFMDTHGANLSSFDEYTSLRVSQNIISPSEDMQGIDFYWPEINAEDFGGVDYDKGCYVGQEVTARLKHKAELKKRIVPVLVMGCPETPVQIATDIQEIGTLLKIDPETNKGLAYVRTDRWQYAVETLRSVTAGSCIILKAS